MQNGEFNIISHYFKSREIKRRDVETGIGDDCAILTPPTGTSLAISTDTLVESMHFLPAIEPFDLGYKSLAVNLSDLAAMGAQPAWALLALTLPEINPTWLQGYCDGFFSLANQYQLQLIGGDTTKGKRSLTITVAGYLPHNRALKRSGAKEGDLIYVTGTLGDSAAGLAILQKRLWVAEEKEKQYLLHRHLHPQPRVECGLALLEIGHSAIDLSDGLAGDLKHIVNGSHCGAVIEIDKLPLSMALKNNVADCQQRLQFALAGGEDYELCFTLSQQLRGQVEERLNNLGVSCHCIGYITREQGTIHWTNNGKRVDLTLAGFEHFL